MRTSPVDMQGMERERERDLPPADFLWATRGEPSLVAVGTLPTKGEYSSLQVVVYQNVLSLCCFLHHSHRQGTPNSH